MIKRLLIFIVLVVRLSAQHPQLLLDSTQLTAMRAKVTGASTDWTNLKAMCDAYAAMSVAYTNPITGTADLSGAFQRGYAFVGNANYISAGYYGNGWYDAIRALGACYQSLYPTDQTTANTYLTQAKHMVLGMAIPPLTITRTAVATGISTNSAWGTGSGSGIVQALPHSGSGGSSCVAGDSLNIVQSGGKNATILLVAVSGGAATTINMLTPGTGYSAVNGLATSCIACASGCNGLTIDPTIGAGAYPGNVGDVRYGLTICPSSSCSGGESLGQDLRAGESASLYLVGATNISAANGDRRKSLNAGDTITVSGAQGCTEINGSWTISSISPTNAYIVLPLTLTHNCTLFTSQTLNNSGYEVRFMQAACAIAYDWFYWPPGTTSGASNWTSTELTELQGCLNTWMYEQRITNQQGGHPESNYYWENFAAWVDDYIALDDTTNTGTPPVDIFGKYYATWRDFFSGVTQLQLTGLRQIRDYTQLWLKGGGFGEGLQAYGFSSLRAMFNAFLAIKYYWATCNSEYPSLCPTSSSSDWQQSPTNFTFVDDNLQYWMYFTTPDLLGLDGDEFSYNISETETDMAGKQTVWVPLGNAVMMDYTAQRYSSTYAAKFHDYFVKVYNAENAAAIGNGGAQSVPFWCTASIQPCPGHTYSAAPTLTEYFMYFNSGASSSNFQIGSTQYGGWSGNYRVSKNNWTTSSVYVRMLGGPTVGSAGNGKTQFDSGAVTAGFGSLNQLIVYGLEEAARSGDAITATQFTTLQNERGTYGNRKNSIFWAAVDTTQTNNQGLGAVLLPPGQSNTVTSFPASISAAEDASAYTFWRGSSLYASGVKSNVDHAAHQAAWTRNLLYVRPDIIGVYDLTTALSSTDERHMIWTMGRGATQVTSGVPAGMTRYDGAAYSATGYSANYRGALTLILPQTAASTVNKIDHDGMGIIFRIEHEPYDSGTSFSHTADRWLALIQPTSASGNVYTPTLLTSTNVDAIQLSDTNHTVLAFVNAVTLTLPLTFTVSTGTPSSLPMYVAGVTSSTGYQYCVSGSVVTINITCSGGTSVTATSSGVLPINAGVTPPTLSSIAVSLSPSTVLVGQTSTGTATCTYSDSSTQDCTNSSTWASATTSVATMSTNIATGIVGGTSSITAALAGVTSPGVTLTVTTSTVGLGGVLSGVVIQ